MVKKKIDNLSYEEALSRLEEIVAQLENAEIPLEESLSAFQEGIALSRLCREKLAEIEYKVDYLLKEEYQQSLALESDDGLKDNVPENDDSGVDE